MRAWLPYLIRGLALKKKKKTDSPFPEALSYTIDPQLGVVLGAHLLSPG